MAPNRSRSIAIHEAAQLVASAVVLADPYFVAQVGDPGMPRADAIGKPPPSSMIVNLAFAILVSTFVGPIADARHHAAERAVVHLDVGGSDIGPAATDDALVEALRFHAEVDAERIVDEHWETICALADDIQVPGRLVDSRHPLLREIRRA